MAQHQAIFNQEKVVIIQEFFFLQLQMSFQRLKGHLSKSNKNFNLEKDSDA